MSSSAPELRLHDCASLTIAARLLRTCHRVLTPTPTPSPSPQGGGEHTESAACADPISTVRAPYAPLVVAYPRSSARRVRILGLRFGFDVDLHLHPELVVRAAGIGAGERHRLAGIARDRDADEIAVADDAVGGVEFHPAGADILRALASPIA